MKGLFVAGLLLASSVAYSQVCFGPGPCPGDDDFDSFCKVHPYDPTCGEVISIPDADLPVGPDSNCMGGYCYPVEYTAVGPFMLAESPGLATSRRLIGARLSGIRHFCSCKYA